MTRHGWWKILVIVALLGVCSISAVEAAGTYTDPQGRFSFTIPDGWQQGSPPQGTNLPPGTMLGGVFNAAAPLNANFNIVTVSVPSGVDIGQIAIQSRAGVAQSIPGYQEGPGGIQSLTVAGQPARRYDYFFTVAQASRLRGAQVITMQANTVYVLTFTAAENDFNTFFQQAGTALNSFAFTGSGGTGGGAAPQTTTLPSTGMPTGTIRHSMNELLMVMAGSALIVAGVLLRRRAYRV